MQGGLALNQPGIKADIGGGAAGIIYLKWVVKNFMCISFTYMLSVEFTSQAKHCYFYFMDNHHTEHFFFKSA